MLNKRVEQIKDMLCEGRAALVMSDVNRFYLSGFKSSAGAVLITKNRAVFLIDFRYYEKAKNQVKHLEVLLAAKLYSQMTEILNQEGVKTLYLETAETTLDSFKAMTANLNGITISDDSMLSLRLESLRRIKTATEISLIKQAQALTDEGFSYILNHIKEGVTEREIALELEFFMRKKGSEGTAFDFIVVSGKNSSLPHGVPTEKKIENGDFVTMDFGAVCGGYRSDMTRTVAVGNISDKQHLVYETVLKAQSEALSAIKPNIKCLDVDKKARDVIYDAGFEGCFGHGLGHSVGLEIHENPACNTRDETPLQSGMIMTVEPGIYIENEFGVRIEDMVLITDTGYINLTKSDKNLIIL